MGFGRRKVSTAKTRSLLVRETFFRRWRKRPDENCKRQSTLLAIGFRGMRIGGETVRALLGVSPIRGFIDPAAIRHVELSPTRSRMRVTSLTEPIHAAQSRHGFWSIFLGKENRAYGIAVEDYRSPRRFATARAAGKSARFWSAPVLWRFGSPGCLATHHPYTGSPFRCGIEVVGQLELVGPEPVDRLHLRG